MSANIDDGPAFPSGAVISTAFGELQSATGTRFTLDGGMSLLDYFAGQVLVGRMSGGTWYVEGEQDWIKSCYRIADMMLKARGQ